MYRWLLRFALAALPGAAMLSAGTLALYGNRLSSDVASALLAADLGCALAGVLAFLLHMHHYGEHDVLLVKITRARWEIRKGDEWSESRLLLRSLMRELSDLNDARNAIRANVREPNERQAPLDARFQTIARAVDGVRMAVANARVARALETAADNDRLFRAT